MSLQKTKIFAVNNTAGNTTLVAEASGGVIINAISCIATSTAAAFTGVSLFLQDSLGTVVFSRSLLAVVNQTDFIHLNGLFIPTTSSGGLTIVVTSVPAAMWVTGDIIYTVP